MVTDDLDRVFIGADRSVAAQTIKLAAVGTLWRGIDLCE